MQRGKHVYLREAADAHSLGSAPAEGCGGEVQGRDADGQPGLLARVQSRGGGDRVVGRDRRRDGSAHLDDAGHASHRAAATAARRRRCPRTLDWDLWLGARRMRPFSPYYVPYNWRGFLDFGTGQIGNWATHTRGSGAVPRCNWARRPAWNASARSARATSRIRIAAWCGWISRRAARMPPVKVYYHDRLQSDDPEAYHVPGMENETILPPANNLADKGRCRGAARTRRRGSAAAGAAQPAGRRSGGRDPNAPRQGAGGPGVRVFGEPLGPAQARHSHRQRLRSSSAPRASWRPATAAKASSCCRNRAGRSTRCRRSC